MVSKSIASAVASSILCSSPVKHGIFRQQQSLRVREGFRLSNTADEV